MRSSFAASALSAPEPFTPEEAAALAPYFGNTDRPIFVLTNLPEVVKGALFARYSRSAKSARRLFLDEFLGSVREDGARGSAAGLDRAEALYSRVFDEYGDDSVAQLGGAHVACEGVSNVLTKVLERGRLMSYLEQSTRYVPYTDRPDGRWKYVVPSEIEDPALRESYVGVLDRAFETYARWVEPMQEHCRRRYPRSKSDTDRVYKALIRTKALDALRGLLPAATRSNVGVYGSGQAYEALLLRMRAHPLAESREVAGLMLAELRKVIPAFLRRVDQPGRGGLWADYLRRCEEETRKLLHGVPIDDRDDAESEVTLTEFDPDGETKVVAAALYAGSDLPFSQLLKLAVEMNAAERIGVLETYIGERKNRRHRPGRAFEHATYTFDVLADYGAFRDLQRHRMLTIDWQDLTARHPPRRRPDAIEEAGARDDWKRVMDESAALHERLARDCSPAVAQYAVSMAYRIRFYMRMNAREAMHVVELRTKRQGHPAYRRVCRRMHELIAERAGHTAIAEAMAFVDRSGYRLGRMQAERASEQRRLPLATE